MYAYEPSIILCVVCVFPSWGAFVSQPANRPVVVDCLITNNETPHDVMTYRLKCRFRFLFCLRAVSPQKKRKRREETATILIFVAIGQEGVGQ